MSYFVEQIKEKDCAFSCLKILLATVHKNKNYLLYPQDQEDHPYSLKDIITLAEKEGVILNAFRLLNKEDIYKEKKFPILALVKDNNLLHMIVIYKIRGKKIYIGDPKKGKVKLNEEDFFKIWNNELLLINDIKKANYKPLKIKSFDKPIVVISAIFQIFSYLALSIAIFFINDEVPFFVPLLLFFIYILLEFAHKQITIYGMKKFDQEINNSLPINCFQEKTFYQNISKYKSSFFLIPIQIISSVLTLLLIFVALAINSYLNILNILIIITANLIFYFIFNYLTKNKEFEILKNESLINEENKVNNKKSLYLSINEKTYQLINLLNLKKYIMLALIIVISLFYSGFSNNISLNFLLFHVFSYYLLSDIFSNLLDQINKNKKSLFYKCIYRNYFGI